MMFREKTFRTKNPTHARPARIWACFTVLALFSTVCLADSRAFFLDKWGQSGTGSGDLSSATALALDSQGNVYVVDRYRVQKFDKDGSFLLQWGHEGVGPAEFGNPLGIATDDLDQIYIADAVLGTVKVFDSEGSFLRNFGSPSLTPGPGQFYFATHLEVAPNGEVFVTDQGNRAGYGNNVQVFDVIGRFDRSFGSFGTGATELQHPYGIALDSQGDVYVVDSANHRIQKFDHQGNHLLSFASPGSGSGQLLRPTGATMDSEDRLFVADLLNHRIQIFSSTGEALFEMGSMGFGDGQFLFPFDVAVGDAGNVYVLDFGNARIQRFAVGTEIRIDVKPGAENTINLRSKGLLSIALLTTFVADGETQDFDATTVDADTLVLGNASIRHAGGHLDDLDGDGDLDLLVHFRIPDIGIECGATELVLMGSTFDGEAVVAQDSITTTNCP